MTTLEQTTKIQEMAKRAYQAFFTPSKYEAKPADRAVIARGNNERIVFEDGELAATTWGDRGSAVLLMHGWGGARAQMTGLVDPLLNAGYRVVAYDQPAHGESDGTMTNLIEIAPTMDLILKRYGKFEAIVAHSFGTLITSFVLVNRNFPPPTRLVYFGAFNRLMDSLPRFQVLAHLADDVIDVMHNLFYEKFGKDVLEAIVNEELVKQINIPALMFHDAADSVTPAEDSRAIAKVWKSAKLIETKDLGHRGALQAKEIHEQVVEFLKG